MTGEGLGGMTEIEAVTAEELGVSEAGDGRILLSIKPVGLDPAGLVMERAQAEGLYDALGFKLGLRRLDG